MTHWQIFYGILSSYMYMYYIGVHNPLAPLFILFIKLHINSRQCNFLLIFHLNFIYMKLYKLHKRLWSSSRHYLNCIESDTLLNKILKYPGSFFSPRLASFIPKKILWILLFLWCISMFNIKKIGMQCPTPDIKVLVNSMHGRYMD